MKRVLIVSRAFAPLNAIGSIRPTKIAKYLKINNDYDISVITTKKKNIMIDESLSNDLKFIDRIIEIETSSRNPILNCLKSKKRVEKRVLNNNVKSIKTGKQRSKVKSSIINYLSYILNYTDSNNFYKKAKIEIDKLELDKYDVVISSYSPFASHQIARYIKNKNPKITWIADFRDPVYRDFDTPLGFKNYCKGFAKRVCKKANIITGVSQGVIDELYYEEHKSKYIITNGFDMDDIKGINAESTEKFTLSYLGGLYSGKRDLTPVFKCIHELINEGLVDKSKIKIIYAGGSKKIFLEQINMFNLTECINVNDFLTRRKSLQIQLESSILLLASWNSVGNTGVITGKFLEYMMIDKPIICTIAGELANSLLKEMIHEANIGFCYEEANDKTDYTYMKCYILAQYNRFYSEQNIEFRPNKKYIDRYDYKNITKQIVELLN